MSLTQGGNGHLPGSKMSHPSMQNLSGHTPHSLDCQKNEASDGSRQGLWPCVSEEPTHVPHLPIHWILVDNSRSKLIYCFDT